MRNASMPGLPPGIVRLAPDAVKAARRVRGRGMGVICFASKPHITARGFSFVIY